MKTSRILFVAVLAAILGVSASASDSKDRFARKLNTLNSIVKELQTGYVDTLEVEKLMDGTIGALLYQIDPYTEYYPSDDQDELLSLSASGYAGIGSVISKRGDNIIIAEPSWNSPARRTGLRRGDVILAVDGDTVRANTDITSVSRRLRGQAGTKVRVDVARPWVGADSLLSFEITREKIVTEPVPFSGILPDSVGYIMLTTFSENAARDVKQAVTELKQHPGLKGLVLDLRGNGGGLLDGAVQIAGLFVPKGTEIVRTRGREVEESIYKTTRRPIAADVPLVVLVDGGTASASEIVSGALQDLDRAVVLGERTFGKGLVQSTRPLPYDDLLKLTTARYYIPSGRLIQALNYAERNEDGTPTRTPDSLTTAYTTRAGRIVRDGGGITPDIVASSHEIGSLPNQLLGSSTIFDFANRYYAAHPEAPAVDAVLADSAVFESFREFATPDRFNYDRRCDMAIDLLRRTAEAEGYMTDSVAAQIDALAAVLRHDLAHDLERDRADITMLLESELGRRYFSDSDFVSRNIGRDSVLTRARELLADPAAYRAVLRPAR
ncbi:MAG: S41 family peptidase [Muribaculaceae bacterium]|nr:S41 family peptidase [Muribaculaceae bacterium]